MFSFFVLIYDIFFICSALLFIIVASENAQSNYHSSLRMNETSETDDNDTLNMEVNDLDTSTITINELHDLHKFETNYKDHYYQVRI